VASDRVAGGAGSPRGCRVKQSKGQLGLSQPEIGAFRSHWKGLSDHVRIAAARFA
jgi:hypothetical protein